MVRPSSETSTETMRVGDTRGRVTKRPASASSWRLAEPSSATPAAAAAAAAAAETAPAAGATVMARLCRSPVTRGSLERMRSAYRPAVSPEATSAAWEASNRRHSAVTSSRITKPARPGAPPRGEGWARRGASATRKRRARPTPVSPAARACGKTTCSASPSTAHALVGTVFDRSGPIEKDALKTAASRERTLMLATLGRTPRATQPSSPVAISWVKVLLVKVLATVTDRGAFCTGSPVLPST
mmetsp:Transcript_2677/g.10664  ORF Transcript_2677/g.10664 Transcript_2677/m.10664 type:complete len:243 (+) Transcript_2677:4236-4964(+)